MICTCPQFREVGLRLQVLINIIEDIVFPKNHSLNPNQNENKSMNEGTTPFDVKIIKLKNKNALNYSLGIID